MTLHQIFAQILDAHMGATKAVTPPAPTYRGWSISWDYGRFTATGPNYEASWEGEETGWIPTGGAVEARTREDLLMEIDAWIEEHPEDQR
jgi:hypothetical protein